METMTVRQNWNDDRIDGLERKVDEGFRHVDRQFEQVDKRFEQVDKRFEQVDKRFEQVDKRFEQVDKRFEQIDKRLGRVEDEFVLLRGEIRDGFKSSEALMHGHYRTMLAFCVGMLTIFGGLIGTLLTIALT